MFKVLVKISYRRSFWLSACNIDGNISLQNFCVAKALMNPYILCKILSFQTRVTEKLFNISGSNLLRALIVHLLSIFRIDIFVAQSKLNLKPKVGVYSILSEILRGFRKGKKKENYF